MCPAREGCVKKATMGAGEREGERRREKGERRREKAREGGRSHLHEEDVVHEADHQTKDVRAQPRDGADGGLLARGIELGT